VAAAMTVVAAMTIVAMTVGNNFIPR
ncbi:hypothetical protein A2U01_0076043, partial [Trifolium medium]|nr:hypothetical protein [Trifolium medium]